jgi:hypothetical protein
LTVEYGKFPSISRLISKECIMSRLLLIVVIIGMPLLLAGCGTALLL